ncbi:MAG: NADH-quinone oxidoreductase subunit E, partial [Syntrophomonadaceae bacterium]|nr:NADH-quinone oxidoreductase subunit E [Syntrophomonadaceae bacterium]
MSDYLNIIEKYKDLPGGIIEAYHALQREYNYIPEDAIDQAAKVFGVSKAKAFGVATFYSYFKVGKRGRYVIRICESAPCHV